MAEVVRTREALSHLDLITTYLRCFNPAAAERMLRRLSAAGDRLQEFPNRGRPGKGGARELPAVPPYVIEYRVEGDRVIILRIRPGRQQPSKD